MNRPSRQLSNVQAKLEAKTARTTKNNEARKPGKKAKRWQKAVATYAAQPATE